MCDGRTESGIASSNLVTLSICPEYSETMHSVICNRVHVVFSTAERRALIAPDTQSRLWAYMGGLLKHMGIVALMIGGTADHVHILLSLPADTSLADAIKKLKTNSSRWMTQEVGVRHFSWQKGYAAFSVSASAVEPTRRYIENQQTHHARRSFAEEWRQILAKHGIHESAVAQSRDSES